MIVACRVLQGRATTLVSATQNAAAALKMLARLPHLLAAPPVVLQRQLADHFCGILRGALHGRHARCLLAAVVLQQGIVQGLQQEALS